MTPTWWQRWDAEVVTALVIGLVVAMVATQAGCTTAKKVGGEVGGTVAEWIACPTDLVDCGHVYECQHAAETPSGLIEICIDDDDQPEQFDEIEALYGHCELTPRHQGLCIYCPSGTGCNAFSGCYGCPL